MKKENYKNIGVKKIFGLVAVIVILGTFFLFSKIRDTQSHQASTSNNPEIVFKQTQKALQLLSTNLNIGIKSVNHIEEYENSKKLIFK